MINGGIQFDLITQRRMIFDLKTNINLRRSRAVSRPWSTARSVRGEQPQDSKKIAKLTAIIFSATPIQRHLLYVTKSARDASYVMSASDVQIPSHCLSVYGLKNEVLT